MTREDAVLLEALRLGLRGEKLPAEIELSAEDWQFLLRRAAEQEILPLVYEAVWRLPSFKALDEELRRSFREKALQIAIRQITQTNEFLTLLLHAQAQGLDPAVLKGIVVRSLYPQPMLRPSVDEDILVSPAEAKAYHAFLLEEGLFADEPEADLEKADELSYHKENSPTYIELHLSLFPPDSVAYGDCNALFADALSRTVTVQIEDVRVRTLAPTDHLLYLLCHAYKHFLHSGVGVRQVCDIGMFAERFGTEIDWEHIVQSCESIRIDRFTAAVFRIGERHLGFAMPAAFAAYEVDESDLLEDMLTGGLYGVSDINRAHSATITLDAVAKQRQGRKSAGALASVFLPLKSMEGKYPYLKKYPMLLPAAWAQRVGQYLFRRSGKLSPTESVRIGSERIRLFKEYGILD